MVNEIVDKYWNLIRIFCQPKFYLIFFSKINLDIILLFRVYFSGNQWKINWYWPTEGILIRLNPNWEWQNELFRAIIIDVCGRKLKTKELLELFAKIVTLLVLQTFLLRRTQITTKVLSRISRYEHKNRSRKISCDCRIGFSLAIKCSLNVFHYVGFAIYIYLRRTAFAKSSRDLLLWFRV